MPFASEAQMRFMYAKHPDIASKWMAEEGGHLKPGTPKKVEKKAKKPAAPSPWMSMGK